MVFVEALKTMFGIGSVREMVGGAKRAGNVNDGLILLFFAMALLMIRAFMVQYCFNAVAPSMIMRFSSEQPNKPYRPISFEEALFLTILVSSLV